jgi:hypothetical protein
LPSWSSVHASADVYHIPKNRSDPFSDPQTYCAIIACLLLALWTGGKPTLRTYEMVSLYWQGWASEEELVAHLEKLKPHVV